MKKELKCLLTLFSCLFISSTVFAQTSTTKAYLDQLHSQGKERVIVMFKEQIDPALIEKYNGTVIHELTIINAVICEISQDNIELLKNEAAVQDVVVDMLVEIQSGYGVRDPEELTLFLQLKEKYLAEAKTTYTAAVQQAYQEYLKFLQEDLARIRQYITAYAYLLQWFRDHGYYGTTIYNYFLNLYYAKIREYTNAFRAAYYEYYRKVALARTAYFTACSDAEVKAGDGVEDAFSGPAEIRWNNLEPGMNSKAAWDRYGLDGTGIKIAFIDTGVNYTLEDIDDNYLGGYDFVDGDEDPINNIPEEKHGTAVVAIAVGEGANKVVGVAPNASYYVLRGIDETGTGWLGNLLAAIEWAYTEPHKADIISMSVTTYGGGQFWPMWKQSLLLLTNMAYEQGIVLVAGSGNEGYDYSGWPAAFDNVISVGGHAEDQSLYVDSNGGVDIVAPAVNIFTIYPDNTGWWVEGGTSLATPHAAGLIALQLQCARKYNLEVNNTYLWELMKHSAVDLGLDPVYQGTGKIYAAKTIGGEPPDPNLGSIDLMQGSIWPFDMNFDYYDYVYLEEDLYPAYFLGMTMLQDLTLTNTTDEPGKRPITIESLNVTTIQKYRDTGEILPGNSTESFTSYEPIALNPGDSITLPNNYYIPITAEPGLYNTVLDLEFKINGTDRILKITDNEASVWCPPGPRPE